MKKTTPVLILLANFACFAQQWEWARTVTFNLPLSIDGSKVRIAPEKNGNFFLSCFHWDGTYGYPAGSALAQCDSSGAEIWQKVFPGKIRIYDIATDSSGNLFVTGDFKDTVQVDDTTLVSEGRNDAFLLKFDNSGVLQWAQRSGGPYNDAGYGVCVNAKGYLFVTGHRSDSAGNWVSFDIGEYTVSKYSSDGSLLLYREWGASAGQEIYYGGRQITVDKRGNILVLGEDNDGEYGSSFVSLLDSTGTLQWSKNVSSFDERCNDFQVDGNNIFVAGGGQWTRGPWTLAKKFDYSGTMQWEHQCNLACDYYWDGNFSTMAPTSLGFLAVGHSECRGMLMVNYDTAGTQLSLDTPYSSGTIKPMELRKDPSGKYIMAGMIRGAIRLGQDSIFCSSPKIFIAKFSEAFHSTLVAAQASMREPTVYPNPSTGTVVVDLSSTSEPSEIIIRNVLGQVVCRKHCSAGTTHSLDLSPHPKGLYFADISTSTHRITKRIVLE